MTWDDNDVDDSLLDEDEDVIDEGVDEPLWDTVDDADELDEDEVDDEEDDD